MVFDKDKYWENRNNTVKVKDADGNEKEVRKPLRGQGPKAILSTEAKPSGDVPVSFGNDGTLVMKNRSYRRQKISLYPKSSQLRKKLNKRKK